MPSPSRDTCSHGEIEHMSGQIGEFLDAYMLLGYDLNGNAVSVFAAKNQQQVDGLTTLFHNYMNHQFGQHPPEE